MEPRRLLSTFTVKSTADDNSINTLRWAINKANGSPQASTIVFDAASFSTPKTITLTQGELDLSNTSGKLTITGPAAGVSVSGGGTSRVFQIEKHVTATLSGLTITGGSAATGAGLYNQEGTTSLINCTISGNSASLDGGGLENFTNYKVSATTSLINCTISGNSAKSGGGLMNYLATPNATATLSLTNCTVSGNSATYGGGLLNHGTDKVENCTIAGCTIAGNTATKSGGGVEVRGGMNVFSTTFSGNQANLGGAIDNNNQLNQMYNVLMVDSVLAGDSASTGPEFSNPVMSLGHNLVSKTDGGSGWVGSDLTGTVAAPLNAKLGPLGYYGGPTATMPLLPGSPAIGKGTVDVYVTTDQRGMPLASPIDIGAFQTNPLVVNTTIGGNGSPSGGLSLRQAVNLANVLGGAQSITFSPTVFAKAQTISLTAGPLELSNTTGTETITGPAAGVTVNGGALSPIFQVDPGVTASVSGLTITSASNSSGGVVSVFGGNLTVTGCTITNSTIGVEVAGNATAMITRSTFTGNGTGIFVGGQFSDTCTVTAQDDNLAGEKIGIQNIQANHPVNATLNWWGSSNGPNSIGAATTAGQVNGSPWLGDTKSLSLVTPDFLGFAIKTGNSYVVTPNTAVPNLGIALGANSVGTVSAKGTILFLGSGGSVTVNGQSGIGFNTDAFTITNAAITFTFADVFKGTAIQFNGTINRGLAAWGTSNSVDVSAWTGTGTVTAPAGTGTIAAHKNAGFTLTNTSLASTDGMALSLSGFTTANLTDTGGGHVFTVGGWTAGGSLTHSGATLDTVTASKSAGFTLTNASLSSTDGMALGLSGITRANLTAAATSGKPTLNVDASGFTGTTSLTATGTGNTILRGGGSVGKVGTGGNLMAVGSGNDILIGGPGSDVLTDNSSGYGILIGRGGADTITGNGKDILISGTTNFDSNTGANIAALDAILAEWASSDPDRISKIKSGVGKGGTAALNATTVQSDKVANTVGDGNAMTQNNWFIVNSKDMVTKKAKETETIIN